MRSDHFVDIDNGEALPGIGPGESVESECLSTLISIRDDIAELGERPVKAVLFIVVGEDNEANVQLAGNARLLYVAMARISDALIEGIAS